MTWAKGQSGNPAGGPLGPKPFATALHRAIVQDDGRRLRIIAEKLIDLAVDGEPWAVQMLADRCDGRAPQGVTVAGDADSPPVLVRAIVEYIRASATLSAPLEPG